MNKFLVLLSVLSIVSSAFAQKIEFPDSAQNPLVISVTGGSSSDFYTYTVIKNDDKSLSVNAENKIVVLSSASNAQGGYDYSYTVFSKTGAVLAVVKIPEAAYLKLRAISGQSYSGLYYASKETKVNSDGKAICGVDLLIDHDSYNIVSVKPTCDLL